MDRHSSPLDVTIIDKDESSEQAYHVVDGFIIEDSKSPFPQNGHLSFVPEEYGKEKQAPPPPPKRTRNHTNPITPNATPLNESSSQGSPNDEPLLPGQLRCEFCHMVGDRERFLPPSRRFCSLTCCKRYSAEKRYYPYGKDEQGIAKSIREGLLNPRSRHLRPGATKQAQVVRDQRRRKMAFYGNQDPPPTKSPRPSKKKRSVGRPPCNNTPSAQRPKVEHQISGGPIILEPYSHPTGTPLIAWSVDDVGDFLTSLGYEAYLDRFVEHEIDGKALSLVKDHHLLMTLKLRLGPTLKICEHVNAIKATEDNLEEG